MFKNIAVMVTANTGTLRSQLMRASGDVAKFGGTVEATNRRLATSKTLMTGLGIAAGVALVTGLKAAITKASEFDTAMRNANTIMKLSEDGFRAISDEVLALSRVVPQSANVLAAGLYNIASAGFAGADGLTVLEASATAAAAGLTTTDTAAKAITSVLNAYGREAGDASDVSDVLFKTVELGVLTFEDLASQLGDVLGLGAAAKIEIADLAAATATMTKAGINTAQATTSLNRAIQSIIDPGDELTQLFQSWGYESGQAALDALSLQGVIEKVRQETGGQAQEVLKYFTEIRAARGVLALMINDGETYAEINDQITDSHSRAGATAAAFAEQQKALSAQWDLFVSQVTSGLILIGRNLTPALSKLLETMRNVGDAVGGAVAGAFEALKPLLGAVGGLLSNLWTIFTSLAKAAEPFATTLMMLVGGPLLVGLTILANALEAVTGFFADNEAALAGLVGVVTLMAIPALAGLAVKLQVLAVTGLVAVINGIATALGVASGAAITFQAALGPVGILLAAAGAAFVYLRERANSAAEAYLDVADAAGKLAGIDLAAPDAKEFTDALIELRAVLAGMGEDAARGYLIRVGIRLVEEEGKSPEDALATIEAMAKRIFGRDYSLRIDAGDLTEVETDLEAVGDQVSGLADSIGEAWGGLWKDIGGTAKVQLSEIGREAAREFASGNWDTALRRIAAAEDALRGMNLPTATLQTTLQYLNNEFAKNLDLQNFSLKNNRDLATTLQQLGLEISGATEKEREFVAAVQAGLDVGMPLVDAIAAAASKYPDLARNADNATGALDDQLGVLDALEQQYIETNNALQEFLDAQRAMFDPLFGAIDAMGALKEAQDAAAEAAANLGKSEEEGGTTLQEVEQANRDVVAAILDRNAAFTDLKRAIDEGRVSEEDAIDTLNRWAREQELTADQARMLGDEVAAIIDIALEWADGEYKAKVEADTTEALRRLDQLLAKLNAIHGKRVTFGVTAQETVIRIPGKGQIPLAQGGILSFAGGGEHHVAQIAPAGSWRVWAEPETGGEAYIPLSPSKRARSTAILDQVAQRFGMELTRAGSAGGRSFDIDINVADNKGLPLAQEVAWQVRKLDSELG